MLFGLVLFAGCGGYRDGVERSQRYLAYRETLDKSLVNPPWRNDVMRLRVPRGFELVPADEAPVGLPKALADLPGIEGVWRAKFPVAGGETEPGWLVVASNRHIWKQGTATLEDSERYAADVIGRLHAVAGEAPPSRVDWRAKNLPEDAEFVTPKTWYTFSVAYPRGTIQPEPHQGEIRLHAIDSLQVFVIALLPAEASPASRRQFNETLALTLQTLRIDGATSPR